MPIRRSPIACSALPLLAFTGRVQAQAPASGSGRAPATTFWPWGTSSANTQAVGTVSGPGATGVGGQAYPTYPGVPGGVGTVQGTSPGGTPAPFPGFTIPGVGTIGPDGRIQIQGSASAVGSVAPGAPTGSPGVVGYPSYGTTTPLGAGLSTAEVGSGLKTALSQGLSTAIGSLGRTDGFYGTPYRIPLPAALQQTSGVLRSVGLGGLVDQLELSLNRAAEQAVPQATQVFGAALRQMTLTDAFGILRGGDTAATDYFRARTSTELTRRFRPIVARSTSQVGAARLYNQVVASAGPLGAAAGFNTDLDTYVTQQATNALFAQVAQQEIAIRRNPVARTSEILRRVFGGGR